MEPLYGNFLDVGDQAQIAFDEAVSSIKAAQLKRSSGARTGKWLTTLPATNIVDFVKCVEHVQSKYESRKGCGQTRDSLSRFAARVTYYGNIMDVLVQHHPEYVSLAWGLMKLLFVGIVNHERSLAALTNALSDIADRLPRMELAIRLFPTERMRNAVSTLYAFILKFLMRAQEWYEEGKFMHALHSLTRPRELHFDDLLTNISSQSLVITDLATAGSQEEQRDMHVQQSLDSLKQREMDEKIDRLTILVTQLSEAITTHQKVNLGAHLQTRHYLSDMQLSKVMELIATSTLDDEHESFRFSQVTRDLRQNRRKYRNGNPFWTDVRLQNWTNSKVSSLIIITGTRQSRITIQGFCTNVVEALQNANLPTIWILKPVITNTGGRLTQPSSADLIKSLISQAIKLNCKLHNDYELSSRLQVYLNASTEAQWFALLGSVLEGLPVVYLIIDHTTIGPSFTNSSPMFNLPQAFHKLFHEMSTRCIKTVVKVLLVSYGPPVLLLQTTTSDINQDVKNVVVQVRESSGIGRKKIRSVTPSSWQRAKDTQACKIPSRNFRTRILVPQVSTTS